MTQFIASVEMVRNALEESWPMYVSFWQTRFVRYSRGTTLWSAAMSRTRSIIPDSSVADRKLAVERVIDSDSQVRTCDLVVVVRAAAKAVLLS